MYPDKLKELILEGESSTVEFKRKFTTPEKIAKEISAFANTIGGWLLFGIDDDGSVVGVQSEKGEISLIETAVQFYLKPEILPEVYIVPLYGKDIVVVRVNESERKPVKVLTNPDDKKPEYKTYLRVGEQSVMASNEMVRVIAGISKDAPPLKMIVGDKERRLFDFLEKHNRATVMDFANLVNISRRRSERLLVRLVRAGVLQIHIGDNSDYFTLRG